MVRATTQRWRSLYKAGAQQHACSQQFKPPVEENKEFSRKMSIIPYLHGLHRPSRLLDQHFGLNLMPEDLLDCSPLISQNYFRPWRNLAVALRNTGSTIIMDKDKFQINLDVQHFSPDEITVKTAKGYVIVEGKHEEKCDEHGYVSRQFVRRYALPKGCLEETVQSSLSSDGVLTVSAPRKVPLPDEGERIVPIQHTGPVQKQISTQEIVGETKSKENTVQDNEVQADKK